MEHRLVEAVKQRLKAAEHDLEQEMMNTRGHAGGIASPPYRMELADIEQLLERHHAKGREEGYKEGVRVGKEAGLVLGQQKRAHVDRMIFKAILETVLLRLGLAQQQFEERRPKEGEEPPLKDKRSKDELKVEALELIVELRAALALLSVDQIGVKDERAEAYAAQHGPNPTVAQALADLGVVAIEIINERHA